MDDQMRDDPHSGNRGYEVSDVHARSLGVFVAVLAGALAVVGAAVVLLFNFFLAEVERVDPKPSPLAEAREARDRQGPPGPLLEVVSGRDLAELRAQEQRRLHAAEWVDEAQGTARIPIDEAMQLVVQRGLPSWPASEETASDDGARQGASAAERSSRSGLEANP